MSVNRLGMHGRKHNNWNTTSLAPKKTLKNGQQPSKFHPV